MYALFGRVIDAVSPSAVENGLVAVEGRRILYAGPAEGFALPEGMVRYEFPGAAILPGFIDAHAHLTGEESVRRAGDTPYDLLLAAAADMEDLLAAGFTGVREMGRFGRHLKLAVEKGSLRGPRVMPGGRVLSISSGHADFDPAMPKEEYNARSLIGYLVDGADDCLRGTRQMFREGAEFIKICATGGVSSALDKVDDVQFSMEELRAIVGEAQRHGTYVAAHCTGTAGTKQALMAGVRSIEHGVMLDGECAAMMKERDATLVTTLSVALGLGDMKGLPPHVEAKAKCLKECCLRSYALAREAGIRVALGTDYSNSPNTPYREAGKEFLSLTRCGYSAMEAITAGTLHGAMLMNMAESTGSLETGKLADIVMVEGNPLEDIAILGDADKVRLVMVGGALVKDTVIPRGMR